MKTISNYFCVISPYEFCICCRSCWKVGKFFTIEQERRSIDAWIVVNLFQPNTTDNFPYPRNCRRFFGIDVCYFITTPSFSFNIIIINPTLPLFVFALPMVNLSYSLGREIYQIPFSIIEYLTLIKAKSWDCSMILRQEVCVTLYGFTEENQWKDWQPLCSQRAAAQSYIINEWVSSDQILAQRFLGSHKYQLRCKWNFSHWFRSLQAKNSPVKISMLMTRRVLEN